ncbi:putative intraflagellar transport 140 like [Monocercomonoides exilis]|uniref:putative intraflagellar transport 140 like n=1 Tax=Monocercomonoides exilis TaxID=2049356 RepID=UPI00355A4D60|nr:putative intraflagellar transport 140 like [Monocercomonoides exilis]|eukprot:MONOS_11314.1-p1 / transcript=MONOS_11314.1 / gene=MONOS_11314 / organism=Monocercomonoides_exilis_PA203 / gene_product=intraflagellar transport 140 homolog / transcript_product=intraflagellar transport 140 homolog / location=Mono_scaffold00562:4273-9490(+) / protein_length=1532 / sequence_SO=supercontig / SO=protein_coding / is_pseudo=false
MSRTAKAKWKDITSGSFHQIAQIFAIGLGNEKKVAICNEEGVPIFEFSCDAAPCELSWDPHHTALLVGCEDGTIYLFHHKKIRTYHEHKHAVNKIQWDPSGSRIITADTDGEISLWGIQERGGNRELVLLGNFDVHGAVMCVTFRTPPPPADPRKTPSSQFAAATVDGNVFTLAQDAEQEFCVAKRLDGVPLRLLYYPSKDSLILLTKNLNMYTISLAVAESQSPILTQIASTQPDAQLRDACWIPSSSGLVAVLADEPLVRMFNMETDDMFLLEPPSGTVGSDTPFISMAYEEHTRSLLATTATGKACVWQYFPDEAIPRPAKESEIIASSRMDEGDTAAMELLPAELRSDYVASTSTTAYSSYGTPSFSLPSISSASTPSTSASSSSSNPSFGFSAYEREEGIDEGDIPQRNEQCWELTFYQNMEYSVNKCSWGPGPGARVFSIMNDKNVSTVKNNEPKAVLGEGVAAIQLSAHEVSLERVDHPSVHIQTGVKVMGMAIDTQRLVVWSGKSLEVYNIDPRNEKPELETRFDFPSQCIAIRGQTLYLCNENFVYLSNLKGTIRQSLPFSAEEGNPCLLNLSPSGHLAVATRNGVVKVMDVRGTEAVLMAAPWRFTKGQPLSLSVNADGSAVSIIALVSPEQYANPLSDATPEQLSKASIPDTRIHVFSVERGTLFSFDYLHQLFYPVGHCWDASDPRFFTVALKRLIRDPNDGSWHDSRDRHLEISTNFFSKEKGILPSDTFTMKEEHQSLIGCSIPYLFFSVRSTPSNQDRAKIDTSILHEYDGLESGDEETLKSMKDFCFNLTAGNMDEAYRNVKGIKRAAGKVWENMAHLCVKTRRVDVMEICLRNMGHVQGMMALRQARSESPAEAQLALVAIQLGLYKEAEKLLKDCRRFDLLNKFYQYCGRWTRALRIARESDQIHLASTRHLCAQHLEAMGDVVGAIELYEQAQTASVEVPRLLYFSERKQDLKGYVEATDTKDLWRMWGQLCESESKLEEAAEAYKRVGETLSLVRVLCCVGRIDEAQKEAQNNRNRLAMEFVAREREKSGNVDEAITLYKGAGRFNEAIRLAKENEREEDMIRLALEGTPSAMILVGEYFEERAMFDKAFTLYRQAGALNKAIEVCFKGNMEESLHQIADDISNEADSSLLERCASFFLSINRHDKAFNMLIAAGQYDEALDVCEKHHVELSEEKVESILETLKEREIEDSDRTGEGAGIDGEKKENDMRQEGIKMKKKRRAAGGMVTSEEKKAITTRLAQIVHNQGKYKYAAKLFSSVGDLTSAMNSIISTGDVEEVITFAGICRSPRVYVLAANYLQSLQWRLIPSLLGHIVSMYKKAKAYDELVSFYESCSQVEIDEYLAYDKALMALKEALKFQHMSPAEDSPEKIQSIERRISLVDAFVQAKAMEETNPMEMVAQMQRLLQEPDIESAVRTGDIYAHLIQHFHAVQQLDSAFEMLKEMVDHNIDVGPYVERETIEDICHAKGVTAEEIGIKLDEEGVGEGEGYPGDDVYMDDGGMQSHDDEGWEDEG